MLKQSWGASFQAWQAAGSAARGDSYRLRPLSASKGLGTSGRPSLRLQRRLGRCRRRSEDILGQEADFNICSGCAGGNEQPEESCERSSRAVTPTNQLSLFDVMVSPPGD